MNGGTAKVQREWFWIIQSNLNISSSLTTTKYYRVGAEHGQWIEGRSEKLLIIAAHIPCGNRLSPLAFEEFPIGNGEHGDDERDGTDGAETDDYAHGHP